MNHQLIKILLIEDDPADFSLIKNTLIHTDLAQFNLKRVARPSAAKKYLSGDTIDLILLDLPLPDARGLEAFYKLKAQVKEIPIVIISEQDNLPIAMKSIEDGAYDYLVKKHLKANLLIKSILYSIERSKVLIKLEAKTQQIKDNELQLRGVIERNTDGMIILNRHGKIRFVNPASEKLFGRTSHELLGEVFGHPVVEGEISEIEITRADGNASVAEIRVAKIKWDGENANLATLRDVTERRRMQAALEKSRKLDRYLAYHDAYTDLPNRQLFYDRLRHSLMQAKRYQYKVAVLYVDLDRFNPENDSLGNSTGDTLLRSIAKRLKECIRENDSVARLGGDEFTIMLEKIVQLEDAAKVAQKIIEEFTRPIFIDGNHLKISASIGISLYPNDGLDVDNLVKKAAIAMYRAKIDDATQYHYYNSSIDTEVFERCGLENDLRKAVESNELVLHYQPQVNLQTNEITGVEALVRWQHPELGLLPPHRFIPLAEETGQIVPIGEWVLNTACKQNKAWQDAGFRDIRVAVNLSARQFHVMKLKESVNQILEETGLNHNCLTLEITESNAMQNVDYTISTLNMLKDSGIHIAIDDFGTGYASLNYLKRFPFDSLKIDRSFVKGLHEHDQDWTIVSTIVNLAHELKLKVLAEGVENENQLACLQSLKCDEMQGFYFSRPVPVDEMFALLVH